MHLAVESGFVEIHRAKLHRPQYQIRYDDILQETTDDKVTPQSFDAYVCNCASFILRRKQRGIKPERD